MPYSRGQVVLALFPFADLKQVKKRPCLVVQDDAVQTGLTHRVLVQITSNLQRTGPTRVRVQMTSPEGQQMGLLTDSVVVTDQIHTVEAKVIYKAIGVCPQMDDVDKALSTALKLSTT